MTKEEQLKKNTRKEYKTKRMKKCHYCHERKVPYGDIRPFCFDNECIKAHNEKTKQKKKKNDKDEFNQNDKSWLKKQARYWCHKYIRERDKNKSCISCGCQYNDLNGIQAGHLKNDGNHAMIRYHEDNINGQCIRCNMHKGGEEAAYEIELRKRIGDERVDHILSIAFEVKRYTNDELKDIILYYKDKIKSL